MEAAHSFSLLDSSWGKKKQLLNKCPLRTAERWKVQVQWPSKGNYSANNAKQFLVHIIRRGETLSSISRQYGVPIQAIVAVNANIVDIDFILEGERLNIPVSAEEIQMGSIRINGKALRGRQGLANILGMHENLKVLYETSSYHSQRPRHIDCLLVLFPVVALVISFTIIAHQHRNDRKAKHQEIKESHASHSGSRTIRWRSILSDHSIDGTVNPSSGEGPNDFLMEDQPLTEFEEFCNEYSKLKPAYLKFLSDCGMSKWGYWRGGSQE